MLQAFKILKGIDRVDPGQFFVSAYQSNTRGHSLKLVKQRAMPSLRQNTFSQRVVVDSPTLNTFKSRLDKNWKRERYNLYLWVIVPRVYRL